MNIEFASLEKELSKIERDYEETIAYDKKIENQK